MDADTAFAAAILLGELVVMNMDAGAVMLLVDILNPESESVTELVTQYAAVAALNPIRYRGYYYDAETGYYFLNTRYYNPEWRRFLNADSLFVAGDPLNASNMYAYCNGNPVMLSDPSGMGPILDFFGDKIGNAIRNISAGLSLVLTPLAERLFSGLTDEILNRFKEGFGSDFATSEFMRFFGGPLLWLGSLTLLPWISSGLSHFLPDFPNSLVFSWPTGIRHLTPWSMKFLVGYAEYFLGFKPDDYGNYTTVDGIYMWQSLVGYNWTYDFFFSLGGPIDKRIYTFTVNRLFGLVPIYYAVWCWKADYWNLGAGAEIGIYYQLIKSRADQGFYMIDDKNLFVKINMQVTYNHAGDPLTPSNDVEVLTGEGNWDSSLKRNSWWITTFRPGRQFPKIDLLNVCQAVSFDENFWHRGLYNAFYNKYHGNEPVGLTWNHTGSQWNYLILILNKILDKNKKV